MSFNNTVEVGTNAERSLMLTKELIAVNDKKDAAYVGTAALCVGFVGKLLLGRSPQIVDTMLEYSVNFAHQVGLVGVEKADILNAQRDVDIGLGLICLASAANFFRLLGKSGRLAQEINSIGTK